MGEAVALWLVWFVCVLALFSPMIRSVISRRMYLSWHQRRYGMSPGERARRKEIGRRKSWDKVHGRGAYDRDILGIEPPPTKEEIHKKRVAEMVKRDNQKRKKIYDLDPPPRPKKVRWRGT